MRLTSLSSLVTEPVNLSVQARMRERQILTRVVYEGSQNNVVAIVAVDVDFDVFNNEFSV